MSKLFPKRRCYEIYPLKNLDHSIYQNVFPFDMYEAIKFGAGAINSVDTLQDIISSQFGIEMSRENFIYILSAVLKDTNSYGGYDLEKVRICTV